MAMATASSKFPGCQESGPGTRQDEQAPECLGSNLLTTLYSSGELTF